MVLLLWSGSTPLPPPEAPPVTPVGVAADLTGRDSVMTVMLRSSAKSNGICEYAAKAGSGLRRSPAASSDHVRRRRSLPRDYPPIVLSCHDRRRRRGGSGGRGTVQEIVARSSEGLRSQVSGNGHKDRNPLVGNYR